MSSDFKIVIPARHNSSRLMGKPLEEIHGKPMIQYVYDIAKKSDANEIIIATDNTKIGIIAEEFGAKVCMTDPDHVSGTDRVAEVVNKFEWEDDTVVVNLQGDEPLMPVALLQQVASNLSEHDEAECATLYTSISEDKEINDPNVVKVVINENGHALYFSRSAIPFVRDKEYLTDVTYKRHLGIYAYRAGLLRTYSDLKFCELEQTEKLEQLRLLSNGICIHVGEASTIPGPGVDTKEDLIKVRKMLS